MRAWLHSARMTETGTMRVKSGLAEMLKGGVIMDVVDAEQAKIAEDAGAVAVMALERVPADIRRDGGVARMSDPAMITEIQEAVTIPVMAKCRIGHFVEAQILQALEIDYIDESEVLTPADVAHHVDKWAFEIPFVCGATNLGEALRRIAEGAAMIRTKGEAGTGDVVNAVTHMRAVFGGIRRLGSLREEELYAEAKELRAPYELVKWVAENGRLPGRHVHRRRDRDTRRTPRSACSSAPTASSSARGSSSRAIRRSVRRRSSRRRRTSGCGDPRPRLRGPGRADGRHLRRRARPRAAARDARLVETLESGPLVTCRHVTFGRLLPVDALARPARRAHHGGGSGARASPSTRSRQARTGRFAVVVVDVAGAMDDHVVDLVLRRPDAELVAVGIDGDRRMADGREHQHAHGLPGVVADGVRAVRAGAEADDVPGFQRIAALGVPQASAWPASTSSALLLAVLVVVRADRLPRRQLVDAHPGLGWVEDGAESEHPGAKPLRVGRVVGEVGLEDVDPAQSVPTVAEPSFLE